MPKRDIHQEVTDRIVAALETADAKGWKMPWASLAGMPSNAITKRRYRGVNVLMLSVQSELKGYRSQRWATYRQWASVDAQVQGGEKGTMIVFYKRLEVDEKDSSGEKTGEKRAIPLLRYSTVFNAEQVDGYVDPDAGAEHKDETEKVASLDAMVSAAGVPIDVNGGRACYSSVSDRIGMPARELFDVSDDPTVSYYSTLCHELTHATGHESRLNRQLANRFGSEAYAAEELIAELGAAFCMAEHGLESEPREDHAHYLKNWLQVLRSDNRAIFTAASKAADAADWLSSQVKEEGAAAPRELIAA